MESEQTDKLKQQMGLAIYFAKAFMEEVGKEKALEVVGRAFRQYMVDAINKEMDGVPPAERLKAWAEFLQTQAASNQDVTVKEVSPTKLAVEVSRCITCEACRDHYVPEICGEQCKAEEAAARSIGPDVKVTRSKSIAAGDDRCEWELEAA